ncbi:hypothetical protein [Conservatibacter flavescens]|uniref:Uncharacterized protein n=1 Tax=Conservatibacter flavescens TaxID=28161 RepID=A0A2M8S2U2_9PAST|nr:hypothetical protein [Conservatibacter flavescens]PJG85473.1 hypothetical protein CVP05_05915 [Conservatibacter flavescens]
MFLISILMLLIIFSILYLSLKNKFFIFLLIVVFLDSLFLYDLIDFLCNPNEYGYVEMNQEEIYKDKIYNLILLNFVFILIGFILKLKDKYLKHDN